LRPGLLDHRLLRRHRPWRQRDLDLQPPALRHSRDGRPGGRGRRRHRVRLAAAGVRMRHRPAPALPDPHRQARLHRPRALHGRRGRESARVSSRLRMGPGMKARWRKAALAAAAALALAATSACTSDDTEPEEDPTTVHEAQITPTDPEETPSQEATSDSDDDGHDDSDHDHHTVLGGDLEDAPSPEDVEEMQDVAEAYWVAFNQRDY